MKKKNLSKTTKLYPAKISEANIKQSRLKNKGLPDYVYSVIFTLEFKVCLMSMKTRQFMKLYKIM